jgi:hypothetical protein
MDILFSPYGVGGLPKSAMAEVQQRTEELLTSSSFQRMLELEKKYKVRGGPLATPLAGSLRVFVVACLTLTCVSNLRLHPDRWSDCVGLNNYFPRPLSLPPNRKTGLPLGRLVLTICPRSKII